MPQFALINPRPKAKPKPRAKPRAKAKPNPRTRRRAAPRAAPRKRRYARRNPRALTLRSLQTDLLMPAVAMGGGALLVDAVYGAVPWPANLNVGPVGALTRAAVAIGAGMLASNFLGKKIGTSVALGGLVTQAYGMAKPQIQAMFPALNMGEFIGWGPQLGYEPPGNGEMGYVSPARVIAPPQAGTGMGMYLNDYSGGYSGYVY